MPIIKSAKKALRQAARRQEKNREWKLKVKTAIKAVEKLVVAKKMKEAAAALPNAYQAIDKAAKNYIVHKNKAAHMKSRLAKLVSTK